MHNFFFLIQVFFIAATFLLLLYYTGLIIITQIKMRRIGKKIRTLSLAERQLTESEAEQCQLLYPFCSRYLKKRPGVLKVAGYYGRTVIRGKYGNESFTNHSLAALPIKWLPSMQNSILIDEENTAEIIILPNGTAVILSLNNAWSVEKEIAIQKAVQNGSADKDYVNGRSLTPRAAPLSQKEFRHKFPLLRIPSSIILFLGALASVIWVSEFSIRFLYGALFCTAAAFITLFLPDFLNPSKKHPAFVLTGTLCKKDNFFFIDRFQIVLPAHWHDHIHEGEVMKVEGWINSKSNSLFYCTSISDIYDNNARSIEHEKPRNNFIRFIFPFLALFLPLFFFLFAADYYSIMSDYVQWKKYGHIEHSFSSVQDLSERVLDSTSFRAGSIVNLSNFVFIHNSAFSTAKDYSYKILNKETSFSFDFSEARRRAEILSRFIRIPICTEIFISEYYPLSMIPYISLYISDFTAKESIENFDAYYPGNKKFEKLKELASEQTVTDGLYDSFINFLDDEVSYINALVFDSMTKEILSHEHSTIYTDYATPSFVLPLPRQYFTAKDMSPYTISSRVSYTQTKKNWITDIPYYEEKLKHLYSMYNGFENSDYYAYHEEPVSSKARVLAKGNELDDYSLALSFSLYPYEQAEKEEHKILSLFALCSMCLLILSALVILLLNERIIPAVRLSLPVSPPHL